MPELTSKELSEANETCETIISLLASIPKDSDTFKDFDSAAEHIWSAKQKIETRLRFESAPRGTPRPSAPPWEKNRL